MFSNPREATLVARQLRDAASNDDVAWVHRARRGRSGEWRARPRLRHGARSRAGVLRVSPVSPARRREAGRHAALLVIGPAKTSLAWRSLTALDRYLQRLGTSWCARSAARRRLAHFSASIAVAAG